MYVILGFVKYYLMSVTLELCTELTIHFISFFLETFFVNLFFSLKMYTVEVGTLLVDDGQHFPSTSKKLLFQSL